MCVVWLAASSAASAATFTLAWDPGGSDVAGYVLSWGTQSGVYTNSVDAGHQTQQQLTGLANDTDYYFVVRAYNSAGILSGPSNEVTGRKSSAGNGFNAGSAALILQNDSTRQAIVAYLSGPPANSIAAWNWLAASGVDGWRLVSAADFNGDGMPDLVWQNDSSGQAIVWYMGGSQGTTYLGWDWLWSSVLNGWRLVDTVDLNHDGKPDLLWQNTASFQVAVWYMGGPNGTTYLGWNWLAPSGVDGWRLMATADFNGDGTPDLVWQNDARQVVVWYMNGSEGNVLQSWDWLSSSSVIGWTVIGANDFNGDGTPDLAWQNDDTRQVLVWYGSGGNVFPAWQWLVSTTLPGWTGVARYH
jgi:hypothetical protein